MLPNVARCCRMLPDCNQVRRDKTVRGRVRSYLEKINVDKLLIRWNLF